VFGVWLYDGMHASVGVADVDISVYWDSLLLSAHPFHNGK
jgi:hypothetical protein